MKKIYLLAAVALVALASCTSDEFVGDNGSPNTGANGEKAITFGSSAAKVTRATSNTGDVSDMLDGQFKVYGTKNVTNYSTVFPNYVAWSSNTVTTSNPDGTASDATKGWEYVGPSGTTYGTTPTNGTLSSEQTIKYWDYAAANYHFVAGSPVSSFTYTASNDVISAAVTGLAGHINANPTSESGTPLATNPVYIAKPVNVEPNHYNEPVRFEFVRQQARVRVGVYETIPGYKITDIKFYTYTPGDPSGTWSANPTSTQNIILNSPTADYFVGGSSASATITYIWSGGESGVSYPYYTFSYDDSGLTKSNKWYGGLLNGVKAITSNHTTISELYGTDKDMDDNSGYFTVIPTPTATTADAILIKCDYTLTSLGTSEGGDGSGETITIHGATAAIPAAFSKWAPNTSYTYLFKISDNTNGKTNPDKPAVGLFPITFDAVAIAENNAEVGYITTVSTPSITTYQEGSVTATGIKYVPGSGKVIYFTVQDNTDGTLKQLNTTEGTLGCVKVFWLGTTAKTEAELQQTAPTTELADNTPSGSTVLELPSSAWTHNGQSIATGYYGTFTPGAEGYYAIQYLTTPAVASPATPAAYTYKVIHVEAASSGGGN